MPVSIHIKEQPVLFRRFGAIWTPTVLIYDADGAERWRIEGYLSRPEFHAQLQMGLGRIAAMRKHWKDSEELYNRVVEEHAGTTAVPEAIYWRGVSRYRQTNDHETLAEVEKELRPYADSVWAIKASVWKG